MRNPDELVKRRHRIDAFDKAERTQKEPVLHRGPGHTCKGSIFDCNRKVFERALTNYWERLFVGWNPYKKEGRGCWEVWQKPIKGRELNNFEHWVADLDFLDLNFINRLREMDAWENKQLVGEMDDASEAFYEKAEREEAENYRYIARHHKKLFAELKEHVASGLNPFWFFSDKKKL